MSIPISDPDNIQTNSSARIASSLERLPAEILENVVLYTQINHKRNVHALFFTHVEAMRFWPRPLAADLTNLRMTCRTIEAKLRHTFERISFGKITLEFNKKGLQDLQRVASHASFSKVVHTLSFLRPSKWSGEFFEEENVEEESIGTLNLFSVLKSFPNVTSIEIGRYYKENSGQRPRTVAFSKILVAASLAKLPLRNIKMVAPFNNDLESVDFRALLPSEHHTFDFSQIEELALSLDSLDAHPREDSDPLASLLLAMLRLRDLELALWNRNRLERQKDLNLDPFFRGKPMGTSLRRCALQGIRLNLKISDRFLEHHKDHLRSLILLNCDLKTEVQDQKIRSLTWPLLLQQLESFRVLRHLELKQLGFDGKRTYFKSQVEVTCSSPWRNHGDDTWDDEGWVYVRMAPTPFRVVVDEQDMRPRLIELQSDFCISDLSWTSDGPAYEWLWK